MLERHLKSVDHGPRCGVGPIRSVSVVKTPRRTLARDVTFRREGFTAIEVVVVMAICGLCLSLLLPAVQRAREASRKTACTNHIRQLILAAQEHESVQGAFPPYRSGFVSSPGGRIVQNVSGHVRLLPFLDQTALFNTFDWNEKGYGSLNEPPTTHFNEDLLGADIAIFHCPSDSDTPGATNYRACNNTGTGIHALEPFSTEANPKFGAFGVFRGMRPARITDGLSQTAFFSERLVGDQDLGEYSPSRDVYSTQKPSGYLYPDEAMIDCAQLSSWQPAQHFSFSGSSWLFSGILQTNYNHVLTPNSEIPDCLAGWNNTSADAGAITARSLHERGVNAAFGDGAVHFISDSIDLRVCRAMASINGGEVFSSPF